MFHMAFNGNLGADPELRQVNESTVCNMRVANNRTYTNRDGEKVTETAWIDVAVWGKQAEACAKYLSKGSGVIVEASRPMSADAYMNNAGEPAASIKVTADRVEFVGGNANGAKREEADTSAVADTDDIPF